jgi:ubiquinone/menaquinone biosynthesis C-methylase UbiE
VHGDALNLPFPNDTFDHAVSIGVLHHTPNCRHGFSEIARVTAPGGLIIIFLYNYWSIYNFIYHVFKPIRARMPLYRIPRWGLRMLQPFVKLHLGQTLSDQQLRNLLGDKLWTPQATFHSVSEVRKWGGEEGLTLTATKKFFLGYANVMRFEKRGMRNMSVRREVMLKCLKCGAEPMTKSDFGYTCGHCGHVYSVDGKIIECIAS